MQGIFWHLRRSLKTHVLISVLFAISKGANKAIYRQGNSFFQRSQAYNQGKSKCSQWDRIPTFGNCFVHLKAVTSVTNNLRPDALHVYFFHKLTEREKSTTATDALLPKKIHLQQAKLGNYSSQEEAPLKEKHFVRPIGRRKGKGIKTRNQLQQKQLKFAVPFESFHTRRNNILQAHCEIQVFT